MSDEQAASGTQRAVPAPDENALTNEQLLSLYRHYGQGIRHREQAYMPIVAVAIPSALIAWADISGWVVAAAGLLSVFIYAYVLMVLKRLNDNQTRVMRQLKQQSNFADVLGVSERNDLLSPAERWVRANRSIVLVVLLVFWACLTLVKFLAW